MGYTPTPNDGSSEGYLCAQTTLQGDGTAQEEVVATPRCMVVYRKLPNVLARKAPRVWAAHAHSRGQLRESIAHCTGSSQKIQRSGMCGRGIRTQRNKSQTSIAATISSREGTRFSISATALGARTEYQ
jgi:hypothetical protein